MVGSEEMGVMKLGKVNKFRVKSEEEKTAVASLEVREYLAEFIRARKTRATSLTHINAHLDNCGPFRLIDTTNRLSGQQQASASNQIGASFLDDNIFGTSDGSILLASSSGDQNLVQNMSQQLGYDHPLRKTASLPTMNSSFKAQSFTKRRQIERRTTMSPLIRRKAAAVRARRFLSQTTRSSSNEYSSNPCIIQNYRSQTRSPTPPSHYSYDPKDIFGGNGSGSGSGGSTGSFKPMIGHNSLAKMGFMGHLPKQGPDKNAIHMRVNEALRKTVIERASSKAKMISSIGGSLDIDRFSGISRAGIVSSIGLDNNDRLNTNQGELKRELGHQRSLDAYESVTLNLGKPTNRDINRFRLSAANDGLSSRLAHGPNNSLSHGLTNLQASQQGSQLSGGLVHQTEAKILPLAARLSHRYSSSSSSTSSLISQQDSFDENSSQAIDLSSSSEASRHRPQYQFGSGSGSGSSKRSHPLSFMSTNRGDHSSSSDQQDQQMYQKILQESFNQLQLCQSQDNIGKLFVQDSKDDLGKLSSAQGKLNSRGQTSDSNDTHLLASLSQQFNLSTSSQSLLAGREESLRPNQRDKLDRLASLYQKQQHQHNNKTLFNRRQLAEQSSRQQHQQQNQNQNQNQQQQQQLHDQSLHEPFSVDSFDRWLVWYQNLISREQSLSGGNHSLGRHEKDEVVDLAALYKSHLFAYLVNQQQLQQQQHQNQSQQQHHHHQLHQNQLLQQRESDPSQFDQSSSCFPLSEAQIRARLSNQKSRQNFMGRTLSSPVLVSSNPLSSRTFVKSRQTSEYDDELLRGGGQQQQLLLRSDDLYIKSTKIGSATETSEEDSIIDMLVDDPQLDEQQDSLNLLESNCSLDLTLNNQNRNSMDKSDECKSSFSSLPMTISEAPPLLPLNYFYNSKELEQLKVNMSYEAVFDENSSTGITFERDLCNHRCICGNDEAHPENGFRVLAIWRRLYDRGLMQKCARIAAREATFEEIRLIHGKTYTSYFGLSLFERIKVGNLDLSQLPIPGLTQLDCGGQGVDIDTFWNEELTPRALRLAVGSVIESALSVARGKLMNAFAIVRPPGLHAENEQMMGFCFFNAIAIAVKILINECQLNRILIVDWDVHHGNGIQKAFYEDSNVMYISIHRYDHGSFFPGTGACDEIGAGPNGLGYNWNIAWSDGTMGDAEYLAAFRSVIMPIAKDFDPSMILVACGFDAASRHPYNFGGYNVSPACFAHMTRLLMGLANGRVVLCLEGGFQLSAICDCAEACLRALLNENQAMEAKLEQIQEKELTREPIPSAISTLTTISNLAGRFWPSVEKWRSSIKVSAFDASNTSNF